MDNISSENLEKLMVALVKARHGFKKPVKDLTNTYIGNKYSSLQSCFDATEMALLSEALVVQQGTRRNYLHKMDEGKPGVLVKETLVVFSRLWHTSGQWIESSVEFDVPQNAKNPAHAIGSLTTYGKRYSYKALLLLGDSENDDDGNGVAGSVGHVAQSHTPTPTKPTAKSDKYITSDQVAELDKLMTDANADVDKFKAFLKVESLSHLPQSSFDLAVSSLNKKIDRMNSNG